MFFRASFKIEVEADFPIPPSNLIERSLESSLWGSRHFSCCLSAAVASCS